MPSFFLDTNVRPKHNKLSMDVNVIVIDTNRKPSTRPVAVDTVGTARMAGTINRLTEPYTKRLGVVA